MSFEDISISTLKGIVRTAFKYGVRSGLSSNISELHRVRSAYLKKEMLKEAEELEFIINFLIKERQEIEEEHQTQLSLTRRISLEIDVGLLVSFRFYEETLTGEVRGFVADKVLIISKFNGKSKLFEVRPQDIKL